MQAIIFDCYGVLTTEGWPSLRQKYLTGDGELLTEANDLLLQLGANLITYNQFITNIAGMTKLSIRKVRALLDQTMPNESLIDFIKTELKPHYKIGMLSNASANWLDKIFNQEQLAVFDAFGLSGETGYPKPQPLAYQMIANKLSVQPSEAVLVDDQAGHCSGARAVGMNAIWYQNLEQTISELKQLLNISKA